MELILIELFATISRWTHFDGVIIMLYRTYLNYNLN